jgi:RHS repeat-associated protein
MNTPATILSIVALQVAAIGHEAAGNDGVTTTVYVGRHFEVRDHDQPVKYVFAGETRVARITSSLSAVRRIQRLRLWTGWNLCGIAVEGARFPTNTEIVATFLWNPTTKDYTTLAANQPLSAGSVVWVKANANVVASIVGNYVERGQSAVDSGGAYVAGGGLEIWPLQLPTGVTVWRYAAASACWQPAFAGDLSSMGTLPPRLAPGEAIYVHTDEPVELAVPDPALGIAYYHQDHLGSSSAVTDAAGALAEETSYYPFGAARHEERLRPVEAHYQFTQKERDRESGLSNFGHRFYHPVTGRWLSPDPKGESGGSLNLYAYCNQNPLKHYDPDGAEIKVTRTMNPKTKATHYQITLKAVFIDVSSKKFSQTEKVKYAEKLKSTIEKSFSGKQGKTTWSTKVDLRLVKDYSEVNRDDHVFRVVDKTKTGAGGEAKVGGMLMSVKSTRYTQQHPDDVDRSNPANKNYTMENYISPEATGSHEFGHSAGLHHHSPDDPNLMQGGDVRKHDNKNISLQQIQNIWKAYEAGRLNQREPILEELTGKK